MVSVTSKGSEEYILGSGRLFPVRFKTLCPARMTTLFSACPIFILFLNASNVTLAARSAATLPGSWITKGFSEVPSCNVPETVSTGLIPEVISATNPPPTALNLDANARIESAAEFELPLDMNPSSCTVKVKGIDIAPTGIVEPSGKLKVIFCPLADTRVTGTA